MVRGAHQDALVSRPCAAGRSGVPLTQVHERDDKREEESDERVRTDTKLTLLLYQLPVFLSVTQY